MFMFTLYSEKTGVCGMLIDFVMFDATQAVHLFPVCCTFKPWGSGEAKEPVNLILREISHGFRSILQRNTIVT